MARARWTILMCGLAMTLPALAWQQTGSTMAPQTGATPTATQAQKIDEAGKAFDAMDDDHDGTVSESEMNRSTNGYPPRDAPTPAQTIQAADLNGDGKLSRDEVEMKASKDFVEGTASQDGNRDADATKATEPMKN